MDCKTAAGLLERYLDNELDRTEARELESHLDTCAECREALTHLDSLRRSLRDPQLRFTAPQALRERIATAAVEPGFSADVRSSRRVARRVATPPSWMRYAAACVLAFGAGSIAMQLWSVSHGSGQVERDLFASHWRALAATSPIDVVSTDRHTVKPWFAGKVAQAPLVLDFADQGFPLIGGRVDYVGADRVPVLVYKHGKHLIDVFVLPPSDANIAGSSAMQGYGMEKITLGDQLAAVVSDMDREELSRFGRLLASAK
jgi:anti-sigma factor RsiW